MYDKIPILETRIFEQEQIKPEYQGPSTDIAVLVDAGESVGHTDTSPHKLKILLTMLKGTAIRVYKGVNRFELDEATYDMDIRNKEEYVRKVDKILLKEDVLKKL